MFALCVDDLNEIGSVFGVSYYETNIQVYCVTAAVIGLAITAIMFSMRFLNNRLERRRG